MRILFVITSLRLGGAERMIAEMSPLIIKAGHQVDIFLFDRTFTPLLDSLETTGVSILDAPKGVFQMWNPLHIFRLRNLIKKGNYDIIHTHNSPSQILTALASKSHSPFLITTEHNTTNKRRKYFFLKWIDPFIYKSYDHIVCVSKQTRENLINDVHINPHKVSVITNGIDISKFSPDAVPKLSKPVPQIKPDDKIILMAASFRKQKDQATLIRALKYLPSNYRLWLAGGWTGKKKCEKLVNLLGLNNRIDFLGERNDMPFIIGLSDIVVLSSFYEGFGLSIIEGMAMGKPCIASDVAGLRDIVRGAGLLFPQGDEKSLAEIIKQCIENPTLSSKISDKCKQRASQYDIKNTVNKHLSLYSRLCR
ncbi:MAG: glycosyltransferase [Muribaculaceae bacterium]|nr:glycosyltransferase [Muribaculaceae bacterium]